MQIKLMYTKQQVMIKKGNSKKIKYVGMKRLKLNHYLKIKQKLDTVKSYEEVKKR